MILLAHVFFMSLASATPIDNFGSVDPKGIIFRGAQPGSKVAELKKLKITDVLIIKKQTGTEVDEETQRLRDVGIRTTQIPMEWDHPDLKKLCFQVVEAVRFLQAQKRAGKRTYFHCTMGEDRTGTVAGLFRMVDQGWSSERAFRQEMCPHGFADGATEDKPASVIAAIEQSLTPIFLTLGKSLTPQGLNAGACNHIATSAAIPTCHN